MEFRRNSAAILALSLFSIDPKLCDFKGLLLRFSRIGFLTIKENKLIQGFVIFVSFFFIQMRRI